MTVPLPNVAGAYYATVHGERNGKIVQNTLAYGITPNPATGTADVAAAQAVADAIAAHWPAFVDAFLHNTYTADLVTCYPLHTPTHPAVSSPMTAAGGLSGDVSPAPVAVVLKHSVIRRGRGSQGRNMFSFFADAGITTSGLTISDSYRDSITAAWGTFDTAVRADIDAATSAVSFFGQLSKIGLGHLYTVSASAAESLLSTQRQRAGR